MEPCTDAPPLGQSSNPMLRERIETIGIQHVFSELMKVLQSITPWKQIDARNRMDIPHGMFGLSLKMFLERRAAQDIAYIDALRKICPAVLQNAKNCIVLDDIHDMIAQLAAGHKVANMRAPLAEIEQSTRLLRIHDDISSDLINNAKECVKLDEKLRRFDGEVKRRERILGLKKDAVLDQVFEERRVIGPIEFRYTCSFKYSFQNCRYKCRKQEEDIAEALAETMRKHSQEIQCSISVRLKLEYEIKDLKHRLREMEEKYSRDVDEVNGLLGYVRNRIELLESKERDCHARLIMFAEEMPRLTAWLIEWDEKKNEKRREEAQALLDDDKKTKNKKRRRKK